MAAQNMAINCADKHDNFMGNSDIIHMISPRQTGNMTTYRTYVYWSFVAIYVLIDIVHL